MELYNLRDSFRLWQGLGRKIGVAIVVSTWGSAPRGVGSKLIFTDQGEMAGSVSGGCVEGAVLEAGLEALSSGVGRLLQFGVADEQAWDVGLACGGEISIYVAPLFEEVLSFLLEGVDLGIVGGLGLIIGGEKEGSFVAVRRDGAQLGSLGEIDRAALPILSEWMEKGNGGKITLTTDKGSKSILFVDIERPLAQLIIIGAVHIAIPLVQMAQLVGYETVVIDPRSAFCQPERFPNVGQLMNEWPASGIPKLTISSETAVALLTHDPKIDDQALRLLLGTDAFYIGALGSRKTHQKRKERLLKRGVTKQLIDQIHAPIGLDLGGRSPEKIALAIMAEIVAKKGGK